MPLATLAPFSVAQTDVAVPVPAATDANAAPVTLELPSTAQAVNEMDLSADDAQIDAGTTVDETATNEALTDVPAPASYERGVESKRFVEAAARKHIESVSVKFSKKLVLKSRPTFVFTFASGFLVAANYYLQYFDTAQPFLGWQDPFEGPAAINGSSLLFVDTDHAFTFEANVKYYFDLYAVSVKSEPTPIPVTPTPTPTAGSATPSPSPLPSPIFGLLTVTPTSFAFTAAGQTQQLVVSEAGYSGSFQATVDDPALASITSGPGGIFVVTASANPGATRVTVSDEHGQTVKVPFTITITTGTISSVHRLR